MKDNIILLVLLIISIIIIISIITIFWYKSKENHVPLNYFTLQEPKYFFYDPDVAFEDETIYQNKLKDSTLFGENNYLRYYVNNIA